jgi:hypothetical protein
LAAWILQTDIVSGFIGRERGFLHVRKDRFDERITICGLATELRGEDKAFVLTRVGVGNILHRKKGKMDKGKSKTVSDEVALPGWLEGLLTDDQRDAGGTRRTDLEVGHYKGELTR